MHFYAKYTSVLATKKFFEMPSALSSERKWRYHTFGMEIPDPNFNFNSPDYRYGFNAQEKDNEISGTGNAYTAEFWEYNPRLGRRWNRDPIDKPWMSPYHAFSNKPIINIDPNGADDSPIYDANGNLMGTDDQGLQGEALVLNASDFKQGMSHNEAVKKDIGGEGALYDQEARDKFNTSKASLPDRPDYDGQMTYLELLKWGREKGDMPVFLDASKIDLGSISVQDFPGVGEGTRINTVGKDTPLDTYGPWGKNYMVLVSADGSVKLSNDRFDYEQHDLGKAWDEGIGTWSYEVLVRRPAISILQQIHGVDSKFGFDLRPYGLGKVKK